MNEPTDEAYERPTLTRTTVETATGRELDVLAEALYGLKRLRTADHWVEPDYNLRARILETRSALRAMSGADLVPDHVLGIGGDPASKPAPLYDVDLAGVRCCHRLGDVVCNKPLGLDEPGWRHWQDGKAPALGEGVVYCPAHARGPYDDLFVKTTSPAGLGGADIVLAAMPCFACHEIPPNGFAAHACVALAAVILGYDDQLAWLRKREVEIGRRIACCTVGGVHWMAAKPCPIHEKPRAPAPWTPSWDERYDG